MTQFDLAPGEVDSSSAVLNVTFICAEAALSLATFVELLQAVSGLLVSVGSRRYGGIAPPWSVGNVITGFSETTDHRRISIEFRAPAEGRAVADCVLAGIQQLRTTPALPAGFTVQALDALASLGLVLDRGVSELWFSRPGETPAYVTAATREVIAEFSC